MKNLSIFLLLLLTYQALAHDEKELPANSVDTNKQTWTRIPIPELNYEIPVKPLFEDPETGVFAMKVKYEAGFTNTWHTHKMGHGMYVLEGILDTSKGQFSPGQFVWFPEGEKMYHGATKENDAIFIFVANKEFHIQYLEIEDEKEPSKE